MRRSFLVPLYVLLVFASGALVGSVGYRLYTAKAASASVAPPHRLTPEEWRKRRIEEMRARLKLSDEQVGKIQNVYDEIKQEVSAFDQRSKAELKAIREKQTEMVRALLSEPQRLEYEKMRQEREERMRQRHLAEEKKNHPGS